MEDIIDPIRQLMLSYFEENAVSGCAGYLYYQTRDILKQNYSNLADEKEIRKVDFSDPSKLPKGYPCNIFALPRADEIMGHLSLAQAEALMEIEDMEEPLWGEISWGLRCLMGAADEYEEIGESEYSKNLYKRSLLACEKLLDRSDIHADFLRGALYETAAVCKLMLDEPGVREYFEKSYECYLRIDRRMKDRYPNDSISDYHYSHIRGFILDMNDYLFSKKTKVDLIEAIGKEKQERLSLDRSLFFLRNSEGISL